MSFEVKVEVNIPDDLFNINAFSSEMQRGLEQVAKEAKDFWITAAGQRLKSSRDAYQKAIQSEGVSGSTITLKLDGGFLPYAVEVGTDGYPMNVARGQVVPLNVNRQIIFTAPQVWRTGTGQPWLHPGFPGMNIADDVIEEVAENLLPKYFDEAVEKL